jgi:4-amino-4-deoxy-L-arabinose transferase-like glycosyltransferase
LHAVALDEPRRPVERVAIMARAAPHIQTPRSAGDSRLPWVLFVIASAAVLCSLGVQAWIVLLTDGLAVLGLLAAAYGYGAWPTCWLGFRQRSVVQQGSLAIALGLSILATFTLVVGLAGGLSSGLARGLLAIGWVIAIARIYRLQSDLPKHEQPQAESGPPVFASAVILLPAAVALAIMLFGACLPPGILWDGEARGYDVLEYHLQAPREYFDAGRITFLPHNVYASFPQQMEMLYLLLMYFAGGPIAAAIPAQLLHAACGVLAIVTLAAWTRPGWPRTIVVATAGTVPWLAYLGCLAYVELGLVYFTALAGVLLAERFQRIDKRDPRTLFAAGLAIGLAAGCKYTAIVFVGVAAALVWTLAIPAKPRVRGRGLLLLIAGATITFCPWPMRNIALTGNPVYPFAYEVFGGKAWGVEQVAQWERGHALPPAEADFVGRLSVAGRELIGSGMFGVGIFALAAAGALLRRTRTTAFLVGWLALLVITWMLLTHMPGRFAVPIVVPLTLLVARLGRWTASPGRARWSRWLVLTAVFVTGAIGSGRLAYRLYRHDQWWSRQGAPLHALLGATGSLVEMHALNSVLPDYARAWVLGDAAMFYVQRDVHYNVVFNRDPWLERAARLTPAETLDWLRGVNVTHVVFSWGEIERLGRTYGFPAFVTPEWVAGLQAAGLEPVAVSPQIQAARLAIYRVPPE